MANKIYYQEDCNLDALKGKKIARQAAEMPKVYEFSLRLGISNPFG